MHFKKKFEIDGRMVGEGCKPYIIAEMSANHGGKIETAINIIKEAKKAGADAIKLQHYKADTITLKHESEDFFIKEGPWKGQYLYDLYEYAHMPWEWTETLQKVAKEENITLFSSPFDYTAVDFLEELNMPAYKIASSELIDLPLIRRIARTGKPIIMSTGFSTLAEISKACEVMIQEGIEDLCIMKCTAEYPALVEEINLETIPHLKEAFNCVVGFSDHTLGSSIPIASVAFGASIIEKHFIIDREEETADSFFSATPSELKDIIDGANNVYKAIGKVCYPIISPKAKRSIIVIKDMLKGESFKEGLNIKSLRPGGGITPDNLEIIVNRKALEEIKKGTLLTWELVGGKD
jgi:pseudaminic acid synthase